MPIPAPPLKHAGQLLPGLLLVVTLLSAPPASAEAPGIEGNYQLSSRTLPGGAVLQAPTIMGFLTYTKTHRNSNLLLRDAAGKFRSFSTVSTYRLTANEYSETLLFNIVSDQSGGNGLVYEVSGSTQTVPV